LASFIDPLDVSTIARKGSERYWTQGVKQGGILSVGFYKAYNNDILNTLERSDMGFKIGTSYVGCPTCADDIMLCAKSEQEAQTLLYINL
jgi:hypothetical protein